MTARHEFDAYLKALRARRSGGLPVTREQLAELRARQEAMLREHEAQPSYQSVGDMGIYKPSLSPDWKSWALLEVEFGPIEPEPTPPDSRSTHPGGRPLKPVMTLEAAGELQGVIDRARENGNELVIADLVKRFGVNRHRIFQAIELRERGYDLCRKPPAEFPAVSGSPGMAYWPPLEKPSKS